MREPVSSLYVHVPFCQTICGYCDFYSTLTDRAAEAPLVEALLTEIAGWQSRLAGQADTVFVGGGTPTTLTSAHLEQLLSALAALARDRASLEFTVEANPATVTDETAERLAAAGVTRVSIGAQSFSRGSLRVLDRIHRPEQVPQTVETVRAAGIAQVNLDLIFGVPGQTLEAWRADLRAAVELAPDHLSCYGLTYESGTPLFERLASGAIQRVDADLEARMYECTIDTLERAGLFQYEISNFARPGCECRHNLRYWHNQPYVGVGPSASGFVDGVRYKNVPDIAQYVRAVRAGQSPRVQSETLTPEQRARETAMLELRLRAGMDIADFERRFHASPAQLFAEAIEKHARLGLLEAGPARIRLSREGLLLADSVISDFL